MKYDSKPCKLLSVRQLTGDVFDFVLEAPALVHPLHPQQPRGEIPPAGPVVGADHHVPERLDHFSSSTTLRSTPMPLISTSATSPGFIHKGGLRFAPTPPGVPLTITSPGSSGNTVER